MDETPAEDAPDPVSVAFAAALARGDVYEGDEYVWKLGYTAAL